MKTYPSDLIKRERNFIKPHLFKRGNPRRQKWKWKTILNALMFLAPHQHLTGLGRYVLRTGCQWRELPNSFPPWQTIYEYHRRFCELGIWEKLNTELRICLRLLEKRNAQPSAVVFDTQSVKALSGGKERGFDGYKRVNGRKRFLLVERPKPVRCCRGAKNTLGLLLLVKVVPGNTAETKAVMIGLERVNEVFDMVELAWADQGFGGEPLRLWMKQELGWDLELTSGISTPGKPAFEVAPRRWVVERTIAWLCRNRRLLCDFERLVVVNTGWVYAAMTLLMALRLAKTL